MPPRIAVQFANNKPQNSGNLHSQFASRLFKILHIFFSLVFGIALLGLPWQSFWENNYLLYLFPEAWPLVSNSYFKGAVLGLGIANILIGIYEIAHFKRVPKGYSQ